MAAPKKSSDELRGRAARRAMDTRRDPATSRGAIRWIADQLGVHPQALRTGVRQAEIDGGLAAGTTTDDATWITELECEVREVRGANMILKQASAFFAAHLHRPSG